MILAYSATTSTSGAKMNSLHQARKMSASDSSGANVIVGSLGSDISTKQTLEDFHSLVKLLLNIYL